MKRSAGILMPISSLPSKHGIGTFGKEAYEFIDFLVKAKQTYWQILPLGHTSYGDSPYQSFSSYAGNPYFIDLDILNEEAYLKKSEYENINWGNMNDIDYALLYKKRYKVLRKACDRLINENNKEFKKFIKQENNWLNDYAIFMALKYKYEGKSYQRWPKQYRLRNKKALSLFKKKNEKDILFWKAIQYFFYKQWFNVKKYANDKGIKIIGDLPIYVAEDSADVWANPKQFQLNKYLKPTEIAGCPPDSYSEDGQRWGNPLYDWDYMKKEKYSWWIDRVKGQFALYDVVRIDHFRGFAGYYAIPAKEKSARHGVWKKGPGYALFKQIKKELGDLEFIAEDLGFLTPDVYDLLDKCGYPGMKNMQFAFYPDYPDSEYLPHNFIKNCVVYVSTHDNEPIMAWFKYASRKSTRRAIDYLHLDKKEGYNWGMIRAAYSGVENLAIIAMQDFLALGMNARINEPSTIGKNWRWRINKKDINDKLAKRIAYEIDMYARGNKSE